MLTPIWLTPLALGTLLGGALALGGSYVLRRRRENKRRGQLDRSPSDFKRLFDIVPCYITVQGRDFRIMESNQTFRRDFGDCHGQKCFSAFKSRDDICPECPVEKTFSDGEIHSSEEIVRTSDGGVAEMIVYSMPVHDEEGHISAVMEVSTNITEVKRLQRQLVLMGLAVAGMAHRTKNILMGLEGGIFVVNEGFATKDNAAVEEGWRMVDRNVHRISRVVKDLLACAKKREPELEEGVSPGQVVSEVHELFKERMGTENIQLCLDRQDAGYVGTFDTEGIRSVALNLIANALDACRFDTSGSTKEHRITLRCVVNEAGTLSIEVADNGGGIPDELTDQVFKSFFSTKGTEGTGLGLLVVQKVAEENRGTVTFSSKEGEGTVFTVTLPDAARKAPGATPLRPGPSAPPP